jgi:flagellar biosynthesis protein
MPENGAKPPVSRRQRATALTYEPGSPAPRVVAAGVGLAAERIIATAKEAGVPIREDASLAEALGMLELGEEVPEVLFVAVAETLAWAYRLDAASAEKS